MDPLEVLLAERACERLTHRYTEAVDLGHASRLADVFAVDGVFDAGLRVVGREEIRRVFTEREQVRTLRTLHVCTNLHVEVTGPDAATGTVALTLYRRRGPGDWSVPVAETRPSLLGHYLDRYVRTDEGWLIAERRLVTAFRDPEDAGWAPTPG